jgi:hypothetical protein
LLQVKNLEIIDKLADQQKFSRLLVKKDMSYSTTIQVRKGSSVPNQRTSIANEDRPEIEEEASTNVNNGLPVIKDYELIMDISN